ncbi:aldo/keto reductase [Acanthopleuribacter pedis]|uniref:Aldo/keto reductase n=1 Tax=Acanthopleuribacter pedis TaxID=442870 RepID=A0A8J7QF56_9BACT|nr:aldo/keto reductase [Acanthopleuribacter pedis]MBO1317245.1 aldo/keto reductase [Acanthopleuribacter pedis]MBO1318552.1 aldo/keto reductase [Acanthopleuribacter pedis]
MKYAPLGSSDIALSKVIMGTWQTGKRMWVGIDDNESIAALRAAFDQGVTSFDTAEVYGNGHAERIIAKALGSQRKETVLLSKVFCNHLKRDQVFEACHRSLENLGTDVIDLYQIHWPAGTFNTPLVPIEETMSALVDLKQQGKIRGIGVSNFSRAQLEEALRFGPIDSVQPPYSLFWRMHDRELIPFCRDKNIAVLAYSPLAQGILADKFTADHQFEEGDHRAQHRLFAQPHWSRVQDALAQLRPIAADLGISMAQLALAWITHGPNHFAIAGARRPDQITNSAAAAAVTLDNGLWQQIAAIGDTVAVHLDDNPKQWAFAN